MENVVYRLTSKEVQSLTAQAIFETMRLPQGVEARTRYQNTVISIHSSDKVMLQGKDTGQLAGQLLPDKQSAASKHTSSDTASIQYSRFHYIGSDEAGSSDYFSPLTVYVAYVSQSHIGILKELGIDGSKRLSDTKIVDLTKQLITFIPHSLLTSDNVGYSERQSIGWSQVKMKAVLHNETIKNIPQKIEQDQLDYIIIDQSARREVYQYYALSALPFPDRTKFEAKGESKSLAVAAAGITSHYAFTKRMDRISKELHMEIPEGASNKVDLIIAKVIQKYDIQ